MVELLLSTALHGNNTGGFAKAPHAQVIGFARDLIGLASLDRVIPDDIAFGCCNQHPGSGSCAMYGDGLRIGDNGFRVILGQ